MKLLNTITYDRVEFYELAPGLVMTIRSEDNTLLDTISKFLRRKASSGELRKILKARSSLKCSDMASASTKGDKLEKGEDK